MNMYVHIALNFMADFFQYIFAMQLRLRLLPMKCMCMK